MRVNMFITSNVVKDQEGNPIVQACNHMVAIKEGKKIASKTLYKTGANSSIATLNVYINGLKALKTKCEVNIHTDIQYLVYTTNQLKTWASNDYVNNYGKLCKNKTLLKKLLKALGEKAQKVTVTRYSVKDKNISFCKEVLKERLLKQLKTA